MTHFLPKELTFSLAGLLTCLSSLAVADLQPLMESDLEEVSGQAIAEIVELYDPVQKYRFLRLRTGARVEINANINKIVLGEYYRNDSYVSQFCNTPSDNGACAEVGGGAGQRTINHPNFVNHPDSPETSAGAPNFTFGAIRAGYSGAYTSQKSNGDYVVDAPNADIILENLSLGAIVGGQLQPLIMENPFLEFVFDETNNLIGLRTGAESQDGHLGNASSSAACNFDAKRCGGAIAFSGNLELNLSLLGLAASSVIQEVARANHTPTVGNGFIAGIAGANPAQTLGDINHSDTREFYLSLQTVPINYPTISGDPARQLVNGASVSALPGFSLNITDGLSAAPLQALNGISKVSNCFNGNRGAC